MFLIEWQIPLSNCSSPFYCMNVIYLVYPLFCQVFSCCYSTIYCNELFIFVHVKCSCDGGLLGRYWLYNRFYTLNILVDSLKLPFMVVLQLPIATSAEPTPTFNISHIWMVCNPFADGFSDIWCFFENTESSCIRMPQCVCLCIRRGLCTCSSIWRLVLCVLNEIFSC